MDDLSSDGDIKVPEEKKKIDLIEGSKCMFS